MKLASQASDGGGTIKHHLAIAGLTDRRASSEVLSR